MLWGTPVGPTLSMVNPPKMLGLNWLVEQAITDRDPLHD